MKRIILAIIILVFICSNAFGQIEKGDTEVSLMGYFNTIVGDDIDANASGSIQLSYGKYFSKYLMIGVAPILSFNTGEDEDGDPTVETDWSGSAFFNLNLTSASKIVPYVTGQYYQFTFDIPDDAEFKDFSYVNIGFGVKNFINEYAAFNVLITRGFSLAEDSDWAIISVHTGLSFIF